MLSGVRFSTRMCRIVWFVWRWCFMGHRVKIQCTLFFLFRRQSSGRLPWRNGRLARSIAADPGTTAHESLFIGGNRRVKLKQSQGFKVTMLRPSKAKEKRIASNYNFCTVPYYNVNRHCKQVWKQRQSFSQRRMIWNPSRSRWLPWKRNTEL